MKLVETFGDTANSDKWRELFRSSPPPPAKITSIENAPLEDVLREFESTRRLLLSKGYKIDSEGSRHCSFSKETRFVNIKIMEDEKSE